MRFKQVGNKRDDVCLVVRNADTVALLPGQGTFLNGLNGTNDGLDVVGANNLNTNFSGFMMDLLYGVVVSPATSAGIPAGGYGEVQVFGFCPTVQLTQATRSATSASWATVASMAAFAGMFPESNANGFATAAQQSFASNSTAATPTAFSQFLPPLLLGQSVASMAGSATATSDTRTAITVSVKAMIRIL